MKQFTFTVILTLTCFLLGSPTTAQTVEKTKVQTAEEKQKEIEVRKFVIDFTKQMDEKKDIRLISESYFSTHFKKNFNSFLFPPDGLPKQLSEVEKFQFNAEIFNAMYLGLVVAYGNNFDFSSSEDEDTTKIINKLFPVEIIDLMRNNRIIKAFIDEKTENIDKDFEDIAQIRTLISDLHKINEALKNHIESQPQKWHETYQIKATERRKEIDYFNPRVCEKEDCVGMPEKSIIYHHDLSPFCFEVVKIKGVYKILSINLRID